MSKGGASEIVAEVSGEEEPQYQSLPEVKKKLKYILPAIMIGVSRRSSWAYLNQAAERT